MTGVYFNSAVYDGSLVLCKNGVELATLGYWQTIAAVVASVYTAHGKACVITSGVDGKHMAQSRHYSGDALDFRIFHLTENELNSIFGMLKKVCPIFGLEPILEKTHIHVEVK